MYFQDQAVIPDRKLSYVELKLKYSNDSIHAQISRASNLLRSTKLPKKFDKDYFYLKEKLKFAKALKTRNKSCIYLNYNRYLCMYNFDYYSSILYISS